jgi:hypothetical protein
MEQRIFHVQDLFYERLREELERDDREWRALDLIHVGRAITEMYTAVQKARSLDKSDQYEDVEGLTEEEMEQFWEKKPLNQLRDEKAVGVAPSLGEDSAVP